MLKGGELVESAPAGTAAIRVSRKMVSSPQNTEGCDSSPPNPGSGADGTVGGILGIGALAPKSVPE
jgi:hypothetical protein